MILASAYAHELPQYGLKVGLTNYAAAYCTGLLLARRVLKKLEMDEEYQGNVEATGEDFSVEPAESRRPFRALLDVGLLRTTTGNRVFGALKGALDGGIDIPHSEKRFAGFNKDSKQLDAEVHRKYIYGGHVAAYMRTLMEDEPEKYQTHFSEYIKAGVEPDNIEEVYKKVHAAIRADPNPKKTAKQPPKEHKRYNLKKLTYDQRRQKLIESIEFHSSTTSQYFVSSPYKARLPPYYQSSQTFISSKILSLTFLHSHSNKWCAVGARDKLISEPAGITRTHDEGFLLVLRRFIGMLDPAMCPRSTVIIPGLLRSKNEMEATLQSSQSDLLRWKNEYEAALQSCQRHILTQEENVWKWKNYYVISWLVAIILLAFFI
ncbi:ribosomal protein L18/L5, Ribosomal protein L5 eukaryotic/L18 archaeal [Artemisia annua]|nr:ribosomal protein L18/L5, Ribosomal protein L5 eukaryotic/L18 archaeal [Artemisia annua]